MALAGVVKKVDNLKSMMQGIETLTDTTVMVGVPQEKDGRKAGVIGNADLAYIHDKGSVAAGIPARPFMEPGIKAVQKEIEQEMLNAGKAVFKGARNVEVFLNRVGLIATRSIKMKITEGIPPPLAPSTIAGRIRRVKGKKRRAKIDALQASGVPDSRQEGAEGIFTPLIVSGQLRNAITYVLRKLRKT
jgi:hypothetical protein